MNKWTNCCPAAARYMFVADCHCIETISYHVTDCYKPVNTG